MRFINLSNQNNVDKIIKFFNQKALQKQRIPLNYLLTMIIFIHE